jgi:hypothetical protein
MRAYKTLALLLGFLIFGATRAQAEKEPRAFRFDRKAAVKEAVKTLTHIWKSDKPLESDHDLTHPYVAAVLAPDCSGVKKKVLVITFANLKRPPGRAFAYFELKMDGQLDFIAGGGSDDFRPNADILADVTSGGPWNCNETD